MTTPLPQLQDIEGIDPIHWWPLAPGWWILIGMTLVSFIGLFVYYRRRRAFKQSWQHHTLETLSHLEHQLNESDEQTVLTALSEAIRRIAMHRYSRGECAGIEGKPWLRWLRENDPAHFDWEARGICLIEAPYAPDYQAIPREDILVLIKAIRKWVK